MKRHLHEYLLTLMLLVFVRETNASSMR